MLNLLKKIHHPLTGKPIERKEPCRICKEEKGIQIAEIDYWDIKSSNLVKCENCGFAQLDPMLNQEETSKGCLAYYIEEALRTSPKKHARNSVRNFRRGYLFGVSLKRRGIYPENILEFGPGSGYFTKGLKFSFPNINITVMDVNREILLFNKTHHQYVTIETALEDYMPELENKFDLIIARDILEHVIDIGKVIENVKRYCKENGHFHFITPNGHEDAWRYYLTYNYRNSVSELLINHVNYFDGKGLLDYLQKNHFSAVEYYTYQLKTTFRGWGWKVRNKIMAATSQKRSADFYINEKISQVREIDYDKTGVMDEWYINKNWKFITYLVSWFHHTNFIKVSPELNIGHEIYGLFKVTKSNPIE